MGNQANCPAFVADVLKQCGIHKSRIAVVDRGGRKSTYGDFYDVILRTCGYLDANRIPKGSFIVINLPNCMEYLAVEFGIWLSGCSIVPVNPLYPKGRTDYITGHCSSPLVIDENVLAGIKRAEPKDVCSPSQDIAAIFYTSGSTGNPKGVIHTFDTLGTVDFYNEIIDIRTDDRFAFGSPLSFIAWIMCIPFLRVGACVELIDRQVMTDIRKLQSFFADGDSTATFLNPSVLRQLDLSGNRNLRLVITGSERVSGLKPQAGYKLVNVYGMTETAGPVCHYAITEPKQNTPIGKFFSRMDYRLEEDGEICLRGPLTPGYYKDPENSGKLWRGGWMHTGDIGRILPDGNLEYVNRKDWMVKINGQRVETGEIVEVIRQMPGVSDAAAKGFSSADGHQYIVAYYVAEDSVNEEALKEFISGKLAQYMIPSNFVRMQALPLNASGKLDMNALQSPVEIGAGRIVEAPSTRLQMTLCKAFETALGISPVGIDDDFFSLGGDSIRVMQLQTACPEINLSSSTVYRLKTVRAIAAELETATEPESRANLEAYPLSQTQTGIFIECMARRGEAVYNNPFLYSFPNASVDADKLSGACVEALKAHPNLFASINIGEDGSASQIKNSAADFELKVENVSDKEFSKIRSGLVQPFDILSDRLFRIRVFRTESAVLLFYDFHHIVFDGSSNNIFLEDVQKAYAGENVEAESYTGFDLACDEQSLRTGDYLGECRTWYLDIFREPDQTSLPDPDIFEDSVTFDKFDIDTGISVHAFSKAAQSLGVTENVLAVGAFGYMLGCCTHSSSSAFATIYNGRNSLKTARTVSMLVKTLPVFCKWDRTTLAGDYFKTVKDRIMGAMAHDAFSFAEICKETAYDSRVIFSYQDELLERDSICGAKCEMIPLLENATGEPLAVQLFKNDGTMSIRTEYRSNMYSREYIQKFIECFSTILSSLLLCGKQTSFSSVELVSDTEKKALIDCGWGKKLDFDRSLTVADMFLRQVAGHPDAVAVVDENGSMSYSELDALSASIARRLMESGVGNEDFVALMMPRLNLFPASYLACFKCGAAYVPMDYEYPVDRLQYMIDDSEAKVLITTREIFEKKTAEGFQTTSKVIFADEIKPSSTDGQNNSRPDGLAYMIYTSGTTGKPKGVMIEHHSLTNLVTWYAETCGTGPGSHVAEHASFSFDGSVTELMTPLCFGGTLYLIPAELRKDLPGLYRYFCDNKIDSVLLTTQLGMAMLRMYDLKLKCLFVGGEKLSGVYKTSVKLFNGYGPTEFTVASSYYQVNTDDVLTNIPIGKAVPNTISAVVDSCGRLLPRGVAGELVLAGEQLSRGYWHRPDITAERFTACPFLEGKKMYHTGDLVKWDADGNLLFLGRIDTQVKLRGFRIELGEIESDLKKFPGIKSAVVAIKEISGLQHLCAYYTADAPVDKEELRGNLASMLTDYMVPTAYVQMDALPMTPNGKVDLRSLPVPEIKAEEIVAPSGTLETTLFQIVSEYLSNSDFGVTSNLISMGLTSLGAITLSLLLERKAGVNIPSPKILEHPTIREWAEFLGKPSVSGEVPQYEKRDHYPLTDNQTGIYIDWEQHRDSTQYNVPMLFHFKGVEPEALCAAVRDFIEAHSYLKTHLAIVDGEVVQTRNDGLEPEIRTVVLESEPDKEYFQSLVTPFDLFRGPLFRFTIFRSPDSAWLLSDIHHIVFDGGSEAIFAKETIGALGGTKIGKENFTAFDYALYYKDWKESDEFIKAEQYFTSLLDGAVAGTIPVTSGAEGIGSATISLNVPRKPLVELCRKAGVTENALFLSAVTQVLHRFSREDNIVILTVSNGRSLKALDRSCGMFVQTLPVVSRRVACSVGESLIAMYREIVDTLSHDKFPYTRIVEKTGLKADILLAYQGDVLGGALTAGGNEVGLTGLASDTAKFPLSINVTPGLEETEMSFEYDRAVFNSTDIGNFAAAVKNFIENITDTDTLLSDISTVSKNEIDEIVALGSGPRMEVARGTIVDLILKNAASHPDDPAVSDSRGTVSYGELDKASDLLAGMLLEAGLHKEDFVSLMLPRTKEYVIAFLSVYKSGGAYVPMDYEYPIDRLQYMLDDSRSRFLITTHDIFDKKTGEGNICVENIIYVDDVDFSKSSSAAAVNASTPDGLAYMIYTSGTTGKPKGVMIEHRALMNMIHWERDLGGIVRGTHFAEHASFSFDASIMDLMTTIAFGGELFIIPEEIRKDPEAMFKFLTDNKIEGLVASTQLGMMLLGSYHLPIRYIMLGGEKLTGSYDRSIKVVNGYGPTEFTVCSSYHVLDPDNESDNIPIGRAVPNTVSAVVDPYGRLLPRGVPGELVLIGPQIARGYWNKEDITAKRFVPCPFVEGRKMYHTGDLVRWSDNGELLFMGRIDTQVKLRGFRIELGEIESQIAVFPAVTAAVAQVKEIGGTQHLCAYFTASTAVDTSALKRHLEAVLTSYMVPDSLMQMDEFPLTPNGKIDVKKLPLPELGGNFSEYVAPSGEAETFFADTFAEILGLDKVGANDSFFSLGGTSLLVMRVVIKSQSKGYSLTYSDIFSHPTPKALAAMFAPSTEAEEDSDADVKTYDYSSIDNLIGANRLETFLDNRESRPLGDILLTGATGFLGIHVLRHILENCPESKVHCLLRPKKNVSASDRLRHMMFYYFETDYGAFKSGRIVIHEGDVTSPVDISDHIDTVINCAALVKHFSSGNEIENVNVEGARNCVEFCLANGARLIQISTYSVAGSSVDGVPAVEFFSERMLYFGQTLHNQYIHSKIMAERLILEAVASRGLDAKIMRVGNLSARAEDGEFQINVNANSFMGRLRIYQMLGALPYSAFQSRLEFSPIDETARAICLLATTSCKLTVFHPYNIHYQMLGDVIGRMSTIDKSVRLVEDDEFVEVLSKAKEDTSKSESLTSLLAYEGHKDESLTIPIESENTFTSQVLLRLGFQWNSTSWDYVDRFLQQIDSLQFFEKQS